MFKSKKILVTAGPTYEYFDDIRFIGNKSSGKQGAEIAKCLQQLAIGDQKRRQKQK